MDPERQKAIEALQEKRDSLLEKLIERITPLVAERLKAQATKSGDDAPSDEDLKAATEKVAREMFDGFLEEAKSAEPGADTTINLDAMFEDSLTKAFPAERKGAATARNLPEGVAPAVRGSKLDPDDGIEGFSVLRTVQYLAAGGDEKYLRRPEFEHLEERALATTPDASGGFLLTPDVAPEVVELRDNATKVVQWVESGGGTVIDLDEGVSQFDINKEASGHTVEWGGENTEATGSDMSFGQHVLTPKKGRVLAKLSIEVLRRSNPSIERAVRNRIGRDFGLGLDDKYLFGDGTGGTPTGLWATSGLTAYTLENDAADGAVPTYDDLVDMINAAEQQNAMPNGFLASARTKGIIQKIKDADGHPIFVSTKGMAAAQLKQMNLSAPGDGEILGVPAFFSNQFADNITKGASTNTSRIITGDAVSVWIARFGGMELRASTEGEAFRANQVHIMGIVFTDIGVSRAGELVKVDGVIPQ